jgi:mycothiol synthase
MLIVRNYRPEDHAATLALIQAAAQHDHTKKLNEQGFRNVWQRSPAATRYEQAALVTDRDGMALGFCWWNAVTAEHLAMDGWVHPRCRRRGVGTALLTAVDAYARRVGSGEIRITGRCYADIPGVQELYRLKGYSQVREFYTMAVTLTDHEFEAEIPPGIRLGTFASGNLEPLVEADNEFFAEHWGSQPRDLNTWREAMMVQRPYDPQLWTLAWDEDRIVGECLSHASLTDGPEDGHVAIVGVHREWRGQGLGRALLAQGLTRLREAGYKTARLSVDSENSAAVNLYRSLGMDVVRSILHFAKTVTA